MDYHVVEVQYKQRAYDGKWEKLICVLDTENQYTYVNEGGGKTILTPTKWFTAKVYDYELEIV